MIKLIVDIIVIIAGFFDNGKYILQSKKMKESCDVEGVSNSFLIISVIVRAIILCYAIYINNVVFIVVYATGMIAVWHCYNTYMKICRKNKKSRRK